MITSTIKHVTIMNCRAQSPGSSLSIPMGSGPNPFTRLGPAFSS